MSRVAKDAITNQFLGKEVAAITSFASSNVSSDKTFLAFVTF